MSKTKKIIAGYLTVGLLDKAYILTKNRGKTKPDLKFDKTASILSIPLWPVNVAGYILKWRNPEKFEEFMDLLNKASIRLKEKSNK